MVELLSGWHSLRYVGRQDGLDVSGLWQVVQAGLSWIMSAIEPRTHLVWYAPTARRHYLSKRAACVGEARARIKRKHPTVRMERSDPADWMTGDEYWSWRDLPRADDLLRRYSRVLFRSLRATQS